MILKRKILSKKFYKDTWYSKRPNILFCKLNPQKEKDKDETVFELFTRISSNHNLRLFSKELLFAGTEEKRLNKETGKKEAYGGILEKYYEKLTMRLYKLEEEEKSSQSYKIRSNGFYENTKNINYDEKLELKPLSNLFSSLLYGRILKFSNEEKDLITKLENITEQKLDTNPRVEFKIKFAHAFENLLKFKTTAYIDTNFINMLQSLVTPDSNSDKTITDIKNEIVSYLSQMFKNIFLRTFYQNKATPALKRTTLAFELGLGILQYIISNEDNIRLNAFINILIPEKFHSISESNFKKVISFIHIMQTENNSVKKELFIKKTFSYMQKKGEELVKKELNVLYSDLILDYLYDLVYQLFSNYPKYIMKLFEKHTDILNPILQYNINYKRRLVRYGNLLLNHLCAENICKPKLVSKNKKTVSMIFLTDTDYISGLEDLFSLTKPMLSLLPIEPSTFDLLVKSFDLSCDTLNKQVNIQYLLQYKSKRRRVHKKENLSLQFLQKPQNHSYTPKTKYKIDLEMLKLFLYNMVHYVFPKNKGNISSYEFLKNFITAKVEGAENILVFYELTYIHIDALLKKYPNIPENYMYHDALYHILTFTLRYSKLGYTEIKEKILGKKQNKAYNGFLEIKALLDKVLQYKLNLVGLIKDAILYSRFEYFVAGSYLDARGRLYNSESFLNIQNNPTSKMFVSIYQNPSVSMTLTTIETLREKLLVHTVNSKNTSLFNFEKIPKTNIDSLGATLNLQQQAALDMFYLANRDAYIVSLQSYFKSSLSKETFDNFLKQCGYRESLLNRKIQIKLEKKNKTKKIEYLNRTNQLNFIKLHIKKIRRTWVVLKKIIELCRTTPHRKEFLVEYDCNNSGSQNIAILLNNLKLAQESNLIGKEEFDSYTYALNQYKTVIESLQSLLFNFMEIQELPEITKEISNKVIFTNTKIDSLGNNISNFNVLLQYNIVDSPGLQTLFLRCYSLVKPQNIPKIAILYCLIPQNEKDLILDLTKSFKRAYIEFCMYMLVLRVAVKLQLYYKKYPWLSPTSNVWKERDIFKKPLMTSYYNATRYTRIKYFQKFFLDYSKIYQQVITEHDLYYLANNLEQFFKKLSEINLKGLEYMKTLTKSLLKRMEETNTNFVLISNSFFTITMKAPAYKALQIETRTLKNKKQQLSILIPDNTKINYKSLANSLSPNIIHSMDAWLVHTFNNKIQKLNYALRHDVKKSERPFRIVSYTNHDNFACNIPIILPLLLKEAYHELIQQNYIEKLSLLEAEDIQALGYFEQGKDPKTANKDFEMAFDEETNPRFIK
jgi:hypothetical protein